MCVPQTIALHNESVINGGSFGVLESPGRNFQLGVLQGPFWGRLRRGTLKPLFANDVLRGRCDRPTSRTINLNPRQCRSLSPQLFLLRQLRGRYHTRLASRSINTATQCHLSFRGSAGDNRKSVAEATFGKSSNSGKENSQSQKRPQQGNESAILKCRTVSNYYLRF